MKVLIVDDSEEIRKRVKALLEEFPDIREVFEAVDGKKAMELHALSKPDVVILDIQMPNGNGLAVLKLIKDDTSFSTRVIMLTNVEQAQYKIRCRELGADAYITKTNIVEDLPKEMERMLYFQKVKKTPKNGLRESH